MSETTEVPTTPGLPDPDRVVDPTLPEGDPAHAPNNPAEELEPGPVGDPSDPSGPVDPSSDDEGNDSE